MRMPISRVRSVTDTSIMFMMPTPPTMSEMSATTSSRFVITRLVAANVSEISVWSRILKSFRRARAEVMAVAQHGGDLADRHRDISWRAGGNPHIIEIGETHQLWGVRATSPRFTTAVV